MEEVLVRNEDLVELIWEDDHLPQLQHETQRPRGQVAESQRIRRK